MLSLKIDDGLQEFDVNGKCKVYFNPADYVFVEKTYNTFNALEKLNGETGEKLQNVTDNAEFFETVRSCDAEMRRQIDELFNKEGFCDCVFGSVGMISFGDGLPIWANLILAIIEQFDDGFTSAKAFDNPRLQKYLKKYEKK